MADPHQVAAAHSPILTPDMMGSPERGAASLVGLVRDVCRWGRLGYYIWQSRGIRGWTRGAEAVELAKASARLPGSPTIVEIGSFLGCSAVLLAGGRRLMKSGRLHCIDPFTPCGDELSVPIYRRIEASLQRSLRQEFDHNVKAAGLTDWIVVHQMTASQAASQWNKSIDLLLLDGDHSPLGARDAFLTWCGFLRPGGVLVVSNSADVPYAAGHEGSFKVVREFVRAPAFVDVRCVAYTTFGVRSDAPDALFTQQPEQTAS